jgi:cysteine sulfinate desulfinase/cysteine desulfurase-like protein
MGLPEQRLESAIRFSFSALNTLEEVEPAARAVRQAVAEIRALNKGRRK